MNPNPPARGDIWDLNFNPTKGREQSGLRPALILSVELFNRGPAELVVTIPISRTQRKVRWHVEVHPPEGGLTDLSYIMCEGLRSVSKARLVRHRDSVSTDNHDGS